LGFRTKWVRTAALILFLIVPGPYMGLEGLIRMIGCGARACVQLAEVAGRLPIIRIPADSVELYVIRVFVTAVSHAPLSAPLISRCHSCEALSRFALDRLLHPALAAFHIWRSSWFSERTGPGPP